MKGEERRVRERGRNKERQVKCRQVQREINCFTGGQSQAPFRRLSWPSKLLPSTPPSPPTLLLIFLLLKSSLANTTSERIRRGAITRCLSSYRALSREWLTTKKKGAKISKMEYGFYWFNKIASRHEMCTTCR